MELCSIDARALFYGRPESPLLNKTELLQLKFRMQARVWEMNLPHLKLLDGKEDDWLHNQSSF